MSCCHPGRGPGRCRLCGLFGENRVPGSALHTWLCAAGSSVVTATLPRPVGGLSRCVTGCLSGAGSGVGLCRVYSAVPLSGPEWTASCCWY